MQKDNVCLRGLTASNQQQKTMIYVYIYLLVTYLGSGVTSYFSLCIILTSSEIEEFY